ncbi:related to conserved hypothetical Ustilaginaceae-specific protein [Ustilago trichophora]|uniref:Related to conserved hypothetical Ustilaginaceae-specific protein n=1 Tax=Ustilago trichophora TaxID=86804 RepID=A0A5C3DQK6_9BASI|nr:related to conserved hypothetical Ustilaginaceae-specific protein [Ustilago trichophora]
MVYHAAVKLTARLSESQLALLSDQINDHLLGQSRDVTRLPPWAHLEAVSAVLHDQLATHFQPTQWPLDRLLTLLKAIIEPHQSQSQTPNIQHDTPTTPTTPTTALAHPSSLQDSPRAKQARSCVPQLNRVKRWSTMVQIHNLVCQLSNDDPSICAGQIKCLADMILKERVELCKVIPELDKFFDDGENQLVQPLTAAYSELIPRFATFATNDETLAFLLVHLAVSTPKPSSDYEAWGTYRHLAQEFNRPYRGNAPERFLAFITQLNGYFDQILDKEAKPYYRGTPIVQSSGTGKTRMVLECHHRTPLLYVCIRKTGADGNARHGFPLADQGVRKFFLEAESRHPSLCDLQVACFLGAWFSKLAESLKLCTTDAAKYQFLSQLNQFSPTVDASHPRYELFTAVSKLATFHFKEVSPALRTGHYEDIFREFLLQPILNLNEQLGAISRYLSKGQSGMPVPPVLVAFDECVEINVTGATNGNTQLNSLRRAWNYIGALRDSKKTLSFWLVLLSTSSSAAHLVDHLDDQVSLRRRNSAPLPTFVGVGFDVLVTEQEDMTRASEASHHDRIIKYGRPLWVSLEKDKFWETVVTKLQGAREFSYEDGLQLFSILASRLALGLVPIHSDRSPLFGAQKLFMDQAVDRHMRIANHISNEAVMQVGSPSEPVLAIAASLIMLENRAAHTYALIFAKFRTQCLNGPAIALFKGTHGELASRIAFTVAWDAAKRKTLNQLGTPNSFDYRRVLTEAVPLESIISGLARLDEANWTTLRQRIQQVQDDGSQTRKALQTRDDALGSTTAWTNFTHFDVLPNQITEISAEYLWYCWKRGVGLQMAHSQAGIDGIIPVFMGNLEQPFEDPAASTIDDGTALEMHAARYMTYVAWEAKNTVDPQPGVESGRTELMLKFAGPLIKRASRAPEGEKPLTERALMTVLLDLGTSTPFASQPRGFQPRVQIIKGTECPRLCIRGVLDPHAYPCLDDFEMRSIFQAMLADLTALPSYEQFNVLPNPVWNDKVSPLLHSISAALDTDDEAQHQAQGMDLD